MSSSTHVVVCGSNLYGQAGVANGEDSFPLLNASLSSYIDTSSVVRVISTQKQSFMLLRDGSILSCGENDKNELGRTGKRSLFQRIDSVEAFSISDIACGDDFTLLAAKDGKVICWGRNDLGQLGAGDREFRERPKVNSIITEGIIQLAAGSQHVLALTKVGTVISWGGNRKGQLGDGQMTSSNVPIPVAPLRHRPVISIACGENHSLALTIGGNVYAWGDNAQGQLGLGDTTTRLRAELVRSLRTAKIAKISCGRQHTMVASKSGLLFAFGSNSFGQLGIGDSETRIQSSPKVVERLREMIAADISCGAYHSLVLCKSELLTSARVYVMGLNSNGQLGLGHTQNVYSPAAMPLAFDRQPVGVASGPLSMTSYVYLDGASIVRPSLPSLEYSTLVNNIERLNSSTKGTGRAIQELRIFRESIASAFSSISVLNASFRLDNNQSEHSIHDPNGLYVDLDAVRNSYDAIAALENPQILSTLGRATLQLSDHLRECPWDDSENLSVFLIVLENPLMLQASANHVLIERVISGILSLPKQSRTTLFSWLRLYSSQHFSRILQVLHNYLSHGFSSKALNLDPAPAVFVLSSLYECNVECRIVPDSSFYLPNLHKSINLFEEWKKYKVNDKTSKVFNYYSYPFLLDYEVKNAVMRIEFHQQQTTQVQSYLMKYLYQTPKSDPSNILVPPKFVKFYMNATTTQHDPKPDCFLEIIVRRENLLQDLLSQLQEILLLDVAALRLPLRAKFQGEDAVDQGGVKKELLTLAVRDLVKKSNIVCPCGNKNAFVWFSKISSEQCHENIFQTSSSCISDARSAKASIESDSVLRNEGDDTSSSTQSPLRKFPRISKEIDREEASKDLCFHLGLLIGLAAYNDVLIDLPLPSSTYKLLTGSKFTLENLFEVDNSLAKGLKYLLEFDGSIADILATTFSASLNPLIDNSALNNANEMTKRRPEYIDLKPNGSDIYVDKGSRQEFVDLFVNWTLYGSCKSLVDAYFAGVKILFADPIINLCTHTEIEVLLCGSNDIGDLSYMRLQTKYAGEYHDEHQIIQWFWDTLSNMSKFDQRKFLHFVTGSDRVPVGGISKLGLIIQSTGQSSVALPTSHTCFNILNIPSSYQSQEQLQNKLIMALENSEGFGFA